ncbi:MAG: SGNH/GDSL hydrolase family protein [Desulfatibacillum sp.]|nr:SGNH/GDSL hydrolase family protein [Desulfatibacillum sp.]
MRPVFHKSRRFAKFALVCLSILLALVAGEAGLRLGGCEPGYIPRYQLGLARVDSVELVKARWFTDQEGIWRADPGFGWPENHINSQGFRSREFQEDHSGKPKVLFLGDSFTWGVAAWPETNSFADLVANQGYVVYNTGIPGADPNQYAYLAEKYIPLLHPDFVAIMFFMGNDFVRPRPMLPGKNLHHITNAGWMYAFNDQGNYMESPRDAYAYWKKHSNWLDAPDRPDLPDNPLKSLLLKTVIGSYAWFHASPLLVRAAGWMGYDFPVTEGVWNKPGQHTIHSLERIRRVCRQYGAECLLFVIPVDPEMENENNSLEENLDFLKDFSPLAPDFISPALYNKKSCHHLNNQGHRLYADFILENLGANAKSQNTPVESN